jgi:hypothetical protein
MDINTHKYSQFMDISIFKWCVLRDVHLSMFNPRTLNITNINMYTDVLGYTRLNS